MAGIKQKKKMKAPSRTSHLPKKTTSSKKAKKVTRGTCPPREESPKRRKPPAQLIAMLGANRPYGSSGSRLKVSQTGPVGQRDSSPGLVAHERRGRVPGARPDRGRFGFGGCEEGRPPGRTDTLAGGTSCIRKLAAFRALGFYLNWRALRSMRHARDEKAKTGPCVRLSPP